MRNRSLASAAAMAMTALLTALILSANVEDDIDELEDRIDDLENRVAALEVKIRMDAATTPEGAGAKDGQAGEAGGVSVSSSSSTTNSSSSAVSASVQSGPDSYHATYSANTSTSIPFEISIKGIYELRITPTSALVLRVESVAGAEVSAFSIVTTSDEPVTVRGELDPGDYLLLVDTPDTWTVDLLLVRGQ